MYIELPSTGCNVIQNATTFYNYSPDSRTRQTWVIYDGQAIKQAETYSQYGYTYTGDCLTTGDLQYKPEVRVYFEHMAIIDFLLILIIPITLFWWKWWRKV